MRQKSFLYWALVLTMCLITVPAHAWVTEVLDSVNSGGMASGSSIGIDSLGAIHVISSAVNTGNLQYSTNRSGIWVTTIVGIAGWAPYTSMVLDSLDKVHVSHQGHQGGLEYSTNATGTWVTTTVDDADGGTSIAADSAGKIHISYNDYANGMLKYATNASGSWVTSIVDGSGDVHDQNSIAVDSADNIYISYTYGTSLKYATNATGSWVTTIVEADRVAAYCSSIALDSLDKVHISYILYANRMLKYATNASGSWVTTIVDTDISVEQNTSMAMDSSDKAHIGYVSWGWGLKYATDVSGSWVTTSVDAKAYDQAGAILALDHSDKVYISYCWGFSDWPAYSLHYATNVSGTWVNTAITLPGSVGTFTSLALDSAGNIYISYNGITNGNGYPKYATNASGSWVKTTVDWASGTGGFTSIGVDSTDKAHISYFDFSNEDLKYSTNASGTWVQTTLDSSGSVGWDTSLALDSSDKLHISCSFYDPATYTGALKYATNISGSWVTTTLDSGIGLKYTSIDVDSADKVHISYLGDSGLKYATNASGTWVTTTVDSSGYVGFSSIGVDSADKVHISYYDEYPNYDLKYATNASGSWETSTIDSAGKVGSLTSIAADSLDNIHIGYRDDSNNSLKYATNASGSWVTETACDRVFGDGEYPSIAVSGSGQVRISHHGLDGTLLLTSKSGPSCIDNDGDSYGNPASTACVYPQLDCKDNPSSDPPICGTCTCGNANCAPCARCINGGATEFNNDGIDSNCDGKDNNCFIATAAFGTEMGGKIPVLSRFRDTYLLNSAAGKAFVAAYYKYSPPLADCIAQRTWLRAVVRTLLLPVIGFVSLLI